MNSEGERGLIHRHAGSSMVAGKSEKSESESHSFVSDSRGLMDCSRPDSSFYVHEIFQARTLGWVDLYDPTAALPALGM